MIRFQNRIIFIYTEDMLQDIYPSQFSLVYRDEKISDDDPVIIGDTHRSLVLFDDHLPRYGQVKDMLPDEYRYLFTIDDQPYFMSYNDLPEHEHTHIRNVIKILKGNEAFAACTGHHLLSWYLTNRFCSACGHELRHSENERSLVCPECGQVIYPRISPAVIVAVTNGDRILVSRYAHGVYRNYALIAGFCEIGETPEDTCRREVMEEVGIKIKDIRYYASQPWGVDGGLLLGFFAHLDGDDTLHVDHHELATAAWVGKDELTKDDNPLTLTSTLMQEFIKGYY